MSVEVRRGDLVYVSFEFEYSSSTGKEHNFAEQGGFRPFLVIQNDAGNKFSGNVIGATLTSRSKKDIPTHVSVDPSTLNNLDFTSIVLLEQIKTISKERLGKVIGRLSVADMRRIDEALSISVGLPYASQEQIDQKVRELVEVKLKQEHNALKFGFDIPEEPEEPQVDIDALVEEKLHDRLRDIDIEVEERVQARIKDMKLNTSKILEVSTHTGSIKINTPMEIGILDSVCAFIENTSGFKLMDYQRDMVKAYFESYEVFVASRLGKTTILNGIADYFRYLDTMTVDEDNADATFDVSLLFGEVMKLRGCPPPAPKIEQIVNPITSNNTQLIIGTTVLQDFAQEEVPAMKPEEEVVETVVEEVIEETLSVDDDIAVITEELVSEINVASEILIDDASNVSEDFIPLEQEIKYPKKRGRPRRNG